MHGDNRQQQGNRQRYRGNERVGCTAEKHEDDQNDEHKGNRQSLLDVVYRVDYSARAVVERRDTHRAGQLRAHQRQKAANTVGYLDGIGAGLTVNRQHHRSRGYRITARPKAHTHALVLDRLLHRGNIAQINRRAIRRPDDQVAVFLRAGKLPLGPEQSSAALGVELPGTGVTRAALYRRRQIVERDAPRPHGRGIGLDPNRRLGAEHVDAGDARQNADTLADLRAGDVIELAARDRVTGQGDIHNGLVVGIGFGKARW